jgi:hypothetical protein
MVQNDIDAGSYQFYGKAVEHLVARVPFSQSA